MVQMYLASLLSLIEKSNSNNQALHRCTRSKHFQIQKKCSLLIFYSLQITHLANENCHGVQSTLGEEIFAETNCFNFSPNILRKLVFPNWALTNNFPGINFRKSGLFKDFAAINSTFTFRDIFSTTSVYGFENNQQILFYLNK